LVELCHINRRGVFFLRHCVWKLQTKRFYRVQTKVCHMSQ